MASELCYRVTADRGTAHEQVFHCHNEEDRDQTMAELKRAASLRRDKK